MPNQPLDENQLQALLRLKRYEQPPPGYFDGLLHRIHDRQRQEMLRRPAWQIGLERIRAFFTPLRLDWSHAGSMAALLVVGIFAIRVALPDRPAGSVKVAGVFQGSQLSASAKTGPAITLGPNGAPMLAVHSGRQTQRDPDGPTRFIIDTQPVSYEATQIRF
jgi:hypothetical protein